MDEDDVTAEMVENCQRVNDMGDGRCDQGNNNAGCGMYFLLTDHSVGLDTTPARGSDLEPRFIPQ